MTLLLVALAASVPFAAIAWLAGMAVESAGGAPQARARLWATALLASAAISPAILLVNGLHVPAPWPAASAAIVTLLPTQTERTPTPAPIDRQAVGIAAPTRTVSEPVQAPNLASMALAILVLGAALRLTGLGLRWSKLRRLAAQATAFENAAVVEQVGKSARRQGLTTPHICLSQAPTPLLVHSAGPAILLPRALVDNLTADQIRLICGHELAHLKRRDDLAIVAESVLVALFWFNPILAAIARRLSAAREEVCDRMALAEADRADRRAYAETLVSTLKLCTGIPMTTAFTGLRANQVRQRLLAILKPAAPSTAKTLAAGGLALGLLAGAGAASLAFAAQPNPVAAVGETFSRAFPQASAAPAPGAAPIEIAQRTAAKPARVEFDVWVLAGANAVFPSLIKSPIVDGFAVNINPTLHSTYEDGPTTFLKTEDIAQTLGRFSTNELRITEHKQVVAQPGGSASYTYSTAMPGARYVPSTPGPDGRVSPMPAIMISRELPPREAELASAAVTNSRAAMLGGAFDLSLTPVVRADGKIRLSIKERSALPAAPVMHVVTFTAAPDGKSSYSVEPTGETLPAVERNRTSTIELGDGEVVVLGGTYPTRWNVPSGANPAWSASGQIVLVRPRIVREKGA